MNHEKDCSCGICEANRRIRNRKRHPAHHTCCNGERAWCCCKHGECKCARTTSHNKQA